MDTFLIECSLPKRPQDPPILLLLFCPRTPLVPHSLQASQNKSVVSSTRRLLSVAVPRHVAHCSSVMSDGFVCTAVASVLRDKGWLPGSRLTRPTLPGCQIIERPATGKRTPAPNLCGCNELHTRDLFLYEIPWTMSDITGAV